MSRRRALMQMAQSKPDCVTQIISPCAFNSLSGRNSVEIIRAGVEAGKTYRVSYNIMANVTEKLDTTDFYVRANYTAWHGYSKRQYGIGLGTTVISDTIDLTAYTTSADINAFNIDTTNVKGTATVNSFTIVEV